MYREDEILRDELDCFVVFKNAKFRERKEDYRSKK